jgi:parallel beta-helix repeat protein
MLFGALFVGFIQFADDAQGATLIVPIDHPTIQDAIDAAFPGDTVEVWDGVYVENVIVNKTVSLVGNSSATTIIDGGQSGDTIYVVSDWVNITGFMITNASSNGINVDSSSYTIVDDCNITQNNGAGIYFYSSDMGAIKNSDISFNNGGGVHFQDWNTRKNTIENCEIYNNSWVGIYMMMNADDIQIIGCNISGHTQNAIYFWDSNDVLIKDTNMMNNAAGVFFEFSSYVTLDNLNVYDNDQYGLYMRGNHITLRDSNIYSNTNEGILLDSSFDYDIINTIIADQATGIRSQGSFDIRVTNSSIVNCTTNLYLLSNSEFDLLNTTLNKTRVTHNDESSVLTVRWFLHVYVNDTIGNPIPGAALTIRNGTGIGIFDGLTDVAGYVYWVEVIEFIENKSSRQYYTDYNITSNDGSLFGWAQPEANVTKSMVVVVTLSSPMPAIDYITIEDAIGGNAIGNMVYRIEDVIPMYAIAYNNTIGFIGPVPATWSSSDPGVGDVDIGPDSKTSFTAFTEGTCFVSAVNASALDTTGVLTIIWLVENLDQATVHPTIQKAINRANPGDRLLAKSWTYYENVIVNKTVTILGTDKLTTVVHGRGITDTFQVISPWVNITGFSIIRGGTGITINNVDNTKIENCIIHSNNGDGIYAWWSENTMINNTEIHSNGGGGITLHDFQTRDTTITNSYIHDNSGFGIHLNMGARRTEISFCNITGNANDGIYMWIADQITVKDNNIWNNYNGITIDSSNNIDILNCNIFSNNQSGIQTTFGGNNYRIKNTNITSNDQEGIHTSSAVNFEISDTQIVDHSFGIWAQGNADLDIINSSIVNSNPQTDIYLASSSKVTSLNTTFNKNSVNITDGPSELTVQWFAHVLVQDFVGIPISGAEVFVQDSNGAVVRNGYADVDGSIKWIVATEYIENQTLKTFFTPHTMTATVATDIVSDSATMDTSKTILLQLSTLQPSVVVNLVTGLQYSTQNVDYDIIASVTQDSKPRMHTTDTQITLKIYDDDMILVVNGDTMVLLDPVLGLYSYSGIITGAGVYFVVANFSATGVTGIGLTSFEIVDWIEEISNTNNSLDQIRDTLDQLNLTSDAMNGTLDSLANQLSAMETNILDKLLSLNETNILSYLQGMNASLFSEIQGLLASITDDIIGMNSSLSDELNTLLGTLTTDNNALRSWLDIILREIDSNLTRAESVLTTKMDDLNNTMKTFNDGLVVDLGSILSSVQDHDLATGENHTDIVGKLDNLLSGGVGEVDLSELRNMITDLASNLSSSNQSLSGDLLGVADDITSFQDQVAQDLADIDSAIQDIEDVQEVIDKLEDLEANLTLANDQLEEKIDDIPTEKEEEEGGFGMTEILLLVVIVLLIIILLVTLMGRKGKSEESISKEPESKAMEEEREQEPMIMEEEKEPEDFILEDEEVRQDTDFGVAEPDNKIEP